MKLFGFGDIVARWIKAYPTVRVPRVHADEELSGTIPFHSGVLRGSVVDPISERPSRCPRSTGAVIFRRCQNGNSPSTEN